MGTSFISVRTVRRARSVRKSESPGTVSCLCWQRPKTGVGKPGYQNTGATLTPHRSSNYGLTWNGEIHIPEVAEIIVGAETDIQGQGDKINQWNKRVADRPQRDRARHPSHKPIFMAPGQTLRLATLLRSDTDQTTGSGTRQSIFSCRRPWMPLSGAQSLHRGKEGKGFTWSNQPENWKTTPI